MSYIEKGFIAAVSRVEKANERIAIVFSITFSLGTWKKVDLSQSSGYLMDLKI